MTDAAASPRHVVRFGAFELDVRSGDLRRNGGRITLSDQPLEILKTLLEHPGEIVTRDELRQRVWPADTFVDFEHGLNAAVRRLREALGESADAPRFIETIPRRGYRFVAPVARAPIPVLAPSWRLRPRGLWLLAAAGAVVATALIAWWAADVPHSAASQPPIRSLAVLPLRNLTGDPAQEWLADGMTEALSSTLAQIGGLKTVISRTSVMKYRHADKSVPQIAKELGVDALVEGSVLQLGNDVRIQVQVIGILPQEHHLWAGTFDGELRNVLALQKRTAVAIAQQIRVTLTTQEQTRLAGARVVEPQAYEAYLRGQYFRRRWQIGGCQKAEHYFKEAIKLDATFANAYAGLAYCHAIMGPVGPPLVELGSQARAEVTRALELDEALAAAHLVLAFLRHRLDYDWTGAEREFQRALALSPNDPDALWLFGEYLYTVDRSDEGLAMVRRATDLDPFNLDLNTGLGFGFFILGKYDEAIAQFQKTLELDHNWVSAKALLARSNAAKGNHDEAVTAWLGFLDQALVPNRVAQDTAVLRESYTRSGWRPFWKNVLDLCREEARRPGTVWIYSGCRPYFMAHNYAYIGDRDAALGALEAAYAQRSIHAVFMNADGLFESLDLRSNPRFQNLVRRMNFPN